MNPEKRQKAENEGVHKFFKLHSSIGLTSMVKIQKIIICLFIFLNYQIF